MERTLDIIQAIADGMYAVYTWVYDIVECHTVSVLTLLTMFIAVEWVLSKLRRK